MKYKGVITFDLDGTLISTQSEAKISYISAFKQTFNLDSIVEPIFKGGVDYAILENLCKEYDILLNNDLKDKFIENYLYNLEKKSNISNWFTYDNVIDFLSFLKDSGYILAIVSGNYYQTGIFKLKSTKILDYFSFLAFNDDEKDRISIMKKAIRFAEQKKLKVIAHFGDAFSDIIASHYFHIPSFLFISSLKYSGFNDLAELIKKNLLIDNLDLIFSKLNYIFYLGSNSIEKIYIDKSKGDDRLKFCREHDTKMIDVNKEEFLLIFNSYREIKNNFEKLIVLDIFKKGGKDE